MPDEPVTWRLWSWNAPENVKTVSPHLIGMNTYWGGRYPALDIFPAFYDFGIWDKMAESRRTLKFPQEYFDQWMARFPKDERAQLEGAMHEGMRVASCMPFSTPQTTKYGFLIPYTNPRGVALNDDAFRITYQDEWQTIDIVDPAWGKQGGGDIRSTREFGKAPMYAVEMVPSRVDEILYYHKKMYETFADGIYWDNFYLKACYTPEEAGGPAWVDDAGRLRPGVNLMGLRSLAKRNAVLMHVLGKRPLEFIHMTNANIVPMLSFGTINLEWEWPGAPGARGGDPRAHDLHERLGPNDEAALALILAESLGLQSGSISSAIDLIHNNSQTYAWQHRTAMAVCLPHEIKCGGTKELAFVHVQMAEFGYGQPGCKVYRYWEENYPLKTEGANVRALVLSNGPKAMLAIGDFGEGGEAALKLDLKALGLPEAARAYDVEKNRQEVRQTGPGAFVLPIKRHDFALVVVE